MFHGHKVIAGHMRKATEWCPSWKDAELC